MAGQASTRQRWTGAPGELSAGKPGRAPGDRGLLGVWLRPGLGPARGGRTPRGPWPRRGFAAIRGAATRARQRTLRVRPRRRRGPGQAGRRPVVGADPRAHHPLTHCSQELWGARGGSATIFGSIISIHPSYNRPMQAISRPSPMRLRRPGRAGDARGARSPQFPRTVCEPTGRRRDRRLEPSAAASSTPARPKQPFPEGGVIIPLRRSRQTHQRSASPAPSVPRQTRPLRVPRARHRDPARRASCSRRL